MFKKLIRLSKLLIKYITDKEYRFLINALKTHKYDKLPDDVYLTKKYAATLNKPLDLINPKTFTEKLQWLKLYDRKDIYTIMVDKCAVKDYVASKIGHDYIIPTLGVWDDPDDIDFSTLPEKFVLKCNHNSGLGMFVCLNKKDININKVKSDLSKGIKQNYYLSGREWPYKNVPPRIIAEKFMEDSLHKELRDYKFFTFNGEPKVLYITQGRKNGNTVADFFDMNFNHLPFTIDHEMADKLPDKPICFEEMKRMASILSEGTPQLRVDFYEVDGRVYFGELTFFHCSGFESFKPSEWDEILGSWIKLPDITLENNDDSN